MKKFVISMFIALSLLSTAAWAEKLGPFSTTNLDGATVTESILSGYKVTMFNIWGTFCPPCLREMPSLGKLAAEMKAQGLQIVGVLCDWSNRDGSLNERQITKARDLINRTGANYPHVLLAGTFASRIGSFNAIPLTFFVDAEGELLAAFTGAQSEDGWRETINEILAKVGE